MSTLKERMDKLKQEFVHAEIYATYESVQKAFDDLDASFSKEIDDTVAKKQAIGQAVHTVVSKLGDLLQTFKYKDIIDATKAEEGELSLENAVSRLIGLGSDWRHKHEFLYTKNKAKEWLQDFIGTGKDALRIAWDRANGVKPQ